MLWFELQEIICMSQTESGASYRPEKVQKKKTPFQIRKEELRSEEDELLCQ